MTKRKARWIIAGLTLITVWLLVAGGRWLALVVPIVGLATILEVRYADRWPFRSSS